MNTTEHTLDLIDAIDSGSTLDIDASFNEIMANKLVGAIELKREEIAANLFNIDEAVYQVIHHGHGTGEGDYKIFPKGRKVVNLTTKYGDSAHNTAKLLNKKGFHQVEVHKNGKKLED